MDVPEEPKRDPQAAPSAGSLTAEEAVRLQARFCEGHNLGYGTCLGTDAWVPGELPSVGDNFVGSS